MLLAQDHLTIAVERRISGIGILGGRCEASAEGEMTRQGSKGLQRCNRDRM